MPRQHEPQQTYVTANTSSSADTDGFLSSFQMPGLAGMAMPPRPYKPAINHSAASTLSAANNHDNFVVGSVRTSSLSNAQRMGLGQSKHAQPRPLPSTKSATPSQVLDDATSPTTPAKGNAIDGNWLKRSFVAKGQVSDDLPSTAAKARESSVMGMRPLPQIPTSSAEHSTKSIYTQHPSSTIKVLENSLVISPTNASATLSSVSPSLDCPEVPSKELISSTSTAASQEPLPSLLGAPPMPSNRNSVIPISPGISSAVNFMMMEWQQQGPPKQGLDIPVATARLSPSATSLSSPICEGESTAVIVHKDMDKEKESTKRHSGGSGSASPDKREMKESWRKSDSTNSHHTVRQNSARSSRPVSWAESFHSAYTIIPSPGAPQLPTSKRLSALITDADFGMPEEELEEVDDEQLGVEDALAAASLADPNPGSSDAKTQTPPSVPSKDSLRKVNRRSISLSSALPSTVVNFLVGGANGKPSQAHPQVVPPTRISAAASASTVNARKASHSISGSESLPLQNHLHQPLTSVRPSYENYHAPSMSFSPSQLQSSYTNLPQPQQLSTTSSIKGKLQSFLPKGEQKLPVLPPSPAGSLSASKPTAPRSATLPTSHHRQPTLSGLGPSAAGLAKRAVERMGKRLGWGDMTSGSGSSHCSVNAPLSSGNSSTTSVSTSMTSGISNYQAPWADGGVINSGFGPGSTQVQGPYGLVPTGSRGSNGALLASMSGHAHHHSVVHTFLPGPSKPAGSSHKRTPNAISLGAMTVMGDLSSNAASSSTLASTSASASTSDSDPFNASGPMLGRRLRAPLRNGKGLFGRELKTVVRETRIVRGEAPNVSKTEGLVKELEERVLPALVVRCAQHLLIWGVQEEGLFRVTGRPRHVSRLRAEFETGVDYDMTECSPGDLDPHAVASVFKAFLRELPDSILTQKLQPSFDAAIYKENSMITSEQMSKPQLSSRSGKALPSNPKSGFNINSLRKPPSLSTLAMPTFNQVPAPSKSLVNAIRSLVVQLPPENRDLIRTVVDLIKATAEGSKATKMPLSNLLLVFCPSLNMSPPLLRVLCEANGLWIEEDKVIDIKREVKCDLVDDGDDVPPPTPEKDRVINISRDDLENDDLETRSGPDEESSLLSSSSLDYHASAEDSSISEGPLPRRRKEALNRPAIPTVYLDTKSYLSSSSSIASFQDPMEVCQHELRFSQRHDSRDDGSVSSDASLNNLRRCHSPPPLSTSAESVSTPTSSANGSFLNLPLEGTEMPKDMDPQRNEHGLPSVRASPQIVGSEPMELRKRPLISNPIPITGSMQFPFPSTPTKDSFTAPTASRRRSIPLLSLSSLSSQSSNAQQSRESPSGSPGQGEFRTTRPSLRLLFSKKSASSFFEDKEKVVGNAFCSSQLSQYLQDQSSPRTASDSSISTPLSAVTAPQTTSSGGVSLSSSMKDLPPPVLDTLIEDSSFKIEDFKLDAKSSSRHDDSPKSEESESSESCPPPESTRSSSNKPVQKNVTLSALDPRTTSPRSLKKSDTQRQRQPALQPTVSLSLEGLSSENSIDKKDEDWMRSVLRAADAAGGFSKT